MINDLEIRLSLGSAAAWRDATEDEEALSLWVDELIALQDAEEAAGRAIASVAGGGDGLMFVVGHALFIQRALAEAHDVRPRDAKQSQRLTAVATDAANRLISSTPLAHAMRAEAWREHAENLTLLGEHAEALAAVDTAASEFEADTHTIESVKLAITRARVRYAMRQGLDEIFRVREAAETARELGDETQYVNARTIEAMILYQARRFDEAVVVLLHLHNDLASAGVAPSAPEDVRTTITLAMLSANIGNALREQGNYAGALEYLERAREMYGRLGHPANAARAEWGLAKTKLAQGNLGLALKELAKVATAFAGLGFVVEVALAQLDRAAIFHTMGKLLECAAICRTLIGRFVEAQMPTATIEALAYLQACASNRSLTKQDVDHVRSFLSETRQRTDVPFLPPGRS